MKNYANRSNEIEIELIGNRGGTVKVWVDFPDDEELIIAVQDKDSQEKWVQEYRSSLLEEHYNNRKNEREDRHTSLDSFIYEEEEFFDSRLNQEKDYIEKEGYEELVSSLNERQKYLIRKCYVEGYSYSEIARLESKDESAIRKAVKRALEKIRKNLK